MKVISASCHGFSWPSAIGSTKWLLSNVAFDITFQGALAIMLYMQSCLRIGDCKKNCLVNTLLTVGNIAIYCPVVQRWTWIINGFTSHILPSSAWCGPAGCNSRIIMRRFILYTTQTLRKNSAMHVYVYWIIKYDTLVRLHKGAPLKWTQWLLALKHIKWNVTSDFVNHFAPNIKIPSV